MIENNMTPEQVVRRFFERWSVSVDEIYQSVRDTMAPDAVWENVGLSRTVGPDEALGVFDAFEQMKTAHHIDVELLAIASSGNTVLTERRDIIVNGDGAVSLNIQVMGAFEIRDGKIVAWRDYFDTAQFIS
ncbi:limonene-1,2-epoxide hydrolase family protein [Emcibacter sp.]|uniref:limonene-1,2-epoxide hydrolase family protein n=1 Tax=Emcibacter sp. TaxID=1979954 RepID=UPI002AA92CC5|nr:limonene-1,2-epoxide hydrolase family protein [Emcibacter sp.]